MLVAGLLFTNHRTAQTASAISPHIATYTFPTLDALHDMRFGVARIVSSMNELLVLSAARNASVQNDLSKRQQETRFINSGRKLFETAFTLFKEHRLLHNNAKNHGYLPLINDIEREYLALTETSNLIIEVSKNAFAPRTVSKLKDVFENREQALFNSIDKALTIGRNDIQVLIVNEMNAIETMDFQTITINCEKQDDPGLNQDPKAHDTITVQDNGCGMPASLCERIFDPFFTTKVVGKGVGTIFKIRLSLADTGPIA